MDWSAQQAKFGALNQGGLKEGASTWDKINAATEASKRGNSSKNRSGWLKWLPTALAAGATLAAAPFTGGASLAGTAAILGGSAAVGAGVGELGSQVLNKEKVDLGNVAQEAAISGVTGAIPIGGAAKAAKVGSSVAKEGAEEVATKGGRGLLSKFGRKTEELGGRLMNSQTNLTRAEMRKIGASAPESFTTMTKKYGLSNLDDIAKVAPNVTGSNGIYSKAVENAIGNSKGIDVGDLRNIFDEAVTQNAVGGSRKKALSEQLRLNTEKMFSRQPLDPLANPLDAFDVAKTYRANARQIKTGATVTAADKAEAKVYETVADAIEKKLYSAPGVSEIVPTLKKDIVKQYTSLAKGVGTKTREGQAYMKLAKEAEGLTDIASLRSIQKPWVVASQIEEGTARAAGNAATKMAGGGGLMSRLTNPVLDAASPRVGRVVTQAGQAMQGVRGGATGVPLGGNSLMAKFTREGVKQAAPRVATDMIAPQSAEAFDPALMGAVLPPEEDQAGVAGDPNATGMGGDQFAPNDDSQDTGAQLMQAAQHALASGDTKGLENIMKVYSLYESQQKLSGGTPKKLSATQEQRAVAAKNALNDMGMIEDAISSGKLGGVKALPGSGTAIGRRLLGTEDLDAALFNVADNILRARSGAATPEAEVKRFASSFLPTPTDSEQAKIAKLQRAKRELMGYMNPSETLAATPEELAAQGAY